MTGRPGGGDTGGTERGEGVVGGDVSGRCGEGIVR